MNARNYPKICANCKWYEKEPQLFETAGACHRYPDKTYKDDNHWCGEFAIMREPRVVKEGVE